ncbi:MAG TPA: winged helix-turn-helix domain-containing protein [Terriglobales bacterium]|nr:winged helix-turn-helix domain-containing protein [Terriglobales bacterium]
MALKTKHFRFGAFRLYPEENLLLRNGTPVPLQPKTFDILVYLVANAGHLITRDELMKAVWPDSFVEETNLTVNISLLRKALGNAEDRQPYIETVPRKGYRFHGAVTECDESPENEAPSTAFTSAVSTPATDSPDIATPAGGIPGVGSREEDRTGITSLPSRTAGATSTSSYRRIAWVTATIVLLAGAVIYLWSHVGPRSTAVRASARSVAILPFQALDPAPDDEYLGLGLADALITRLGNLHQLVVRPVGAVRKYATAEDPIAAGRQLGVESVMEGSVQRIGERTRVTARLLRVSDGEVIWAGKFDENFVDMFQVEDSISQELANALTVRSTDDERRRFTRAATGSGEAYQLYLHGRFFWNKRSADGVKKSLHYFEQAIQNDPNYALAYAGLADSYLLAGSYGYSILPPREAMPKARAAAQQALAIDDTLAEAHTSLAYIHFTYDWDWAGAEEEFKTAINLNPGYDTAHHWYSHELTALGRTQESLAEAKRALELAPTDTVMNEHMGWHYMMARDYEHAIPNCRRALELDPNFLLAHRVLGLAYQYEKRYPEALQEFQKGVELSQADPVAEAYLARADAAAGQKEQASQILNHLLELSRQEYVSPLEIAGVYASVGDKDEAFRWLNKAYDERTSSLIYLKVDRAYDVLRSDPRFTEIMRRMKLEP